MNGSHRQGYSRRRDAALVSCARNVMVDADFSTAQTAEVLLRPIRARAVKRIRFLMVDPFDFETFMQVVP
jgi:hypothetical protein